MKEPHTKDRGGNSEGISDVLGREAVFGRTILELDSSIDSEPGWQKRAEKSFEGPEVSPTDCYVNVRDED
jgi:hypothetical protein